ncbi:unnamed protein product [Calypogeia fissa]
MNEASTLKELLFLRRKVSLSKAFSLSTPFQAMIQLRDMSLLQVRAFGAMMVLGAVMSIAMIPVHAEQNNHLNPSCPTGFANFGDSLTDTGNLLDFFAYTEAAENPPYGEKFFGKPAKRYSNGRLVPDFFSLAFGKPLLDAYFSVTSFNYKYGINFAVAGATAAYSTIALEPISVTPLQTSQFVRFQNSVIASHNQSGCRNFNTDLPDTKIKNLWSSWLYTIKAGTNDVLTTTIGSGEPISTVNATIVPSAVNAIVTAIVTLYNKGARQFLISGLEVGGCSPFILTALRDANLTKDSLGCIADVNSVVQHFNGLLFSEIKFLRQNLTGANLAYFDYYSANIEILTHPTTYGFDPAKTMTACCGAPGKGTWNYNPNVPCGQVPALGWNNCPNPDQYVNWDGIHFTEAFYRYMAHFYLNDQYTDGGVNYAKLCNLDYANWGKNVTFEQAYPLQMCNNLFT